MGVLGAVSEGCCCCAVGAAEAEAGEEGDATDDGDAEDGMEA